jgi:hypothetical protein
MKRQATVLVMLVLIGAMARGESRTWTSSNGRFRVEAELIDVKDGKAQLKKSEGQLIDVPLGSLSAADRDYVKKQFPGVEEEQVRPDADYREWKSKNGKFSTLAEFAGYSEGKVRLRKPDGTEICVERGQLSAADQRWLADEVRSKRDREDEGPAAKTAAEEPAGELGSGEVSLKLLRLEPPRGRSRSRGAAPSDYALRLTTPQHFFMQLGGASGGSDNAEFRRLVQKEPQYRAPVPFRGVAKLGSRGYAFALDSSGPRAAGYNKLYFDANGNGDLTDDPPFTATDVTSGSGVVQSQFPRVDVKLEADGKPFDYSFLLSAICRQSGSGSEAYASVALYSAAVREGYLAEGKKRTRLILLDCNSNGRFDDKMTMRSAGGQVTPTGGDLLLVNPNPKDLLSADATMGRDRHFLSKTVCIGQHFYRIEVSPAGDSLKLTPAQFSMGYVTNSSPAYRTLVYSDDYGVLLIGGARDQTIPLPEGSWKIASYTIDAGGATGGARTAVSATFSGDAAAVAVSQGRTARLAFGAPFQAVVTAQRRDSSKVYLSLAIVGAAGERCTSLYVNGNRPPAPYFMVKDMDGKTVAQGKFEYG